MSTRAANTAVLRRNPEVHSNNGWPLTVRWDAPGIRDELLKLGFEISERMVSRLDAEAGPKTLSKPGKRTDCVILLFLHLRRLLFRM